MPRKIESWTASKLGHPYLLAEAFSKLSETETVIAILAVIDTVLADLIAASLLDDPKEVEDFVGLDADGRAPLGSLGARIQAAYLLGLISKSQLRSLRCLKDIRNLFSHNVQVNFEDSRVVSKVKLLIEIALKAPPFKRKNRIYPTNEEFAAKIEKSGFSRDACCGYFTRSAIAQLKLLHEKCRRKLGRKKVQRS